MAKETDLALKVIEWFENQHWDVYQEVAVGSSVADIISIQGQLIWIVECKLSLSLELIAQAMEWVKDAHFVSIAIPKQKSIYKSKSRWAAKRILNHYGIGIIEVPRSRGSYIFNDFDRHWTKPRLNRKAHTHLIKGALDERQKYYAPAGSKSGYWTPFKQTCREVERIVKRYPGIILKDLINKLDDHHYASDASAKASINHWASKGKIDGIICKRDGKYLKFYPIDNEELENG